MSRTIRASISIALAALLCGAVVPPAHAERNQARTSVNKAKNSNRNTNVNRNVNQNRNVNVNQNRNVNRNVDIDRDVDIDVDVDHHHGCCYSGYHSGWGTAAAVTAAAVTTAIVVGSVVNTLPPSCTVVVVNGFTYQQCGNTWYQPQFVGTSTSYIVVNPPR